MKETLLRMTNICKSFVGVNALQNIDLDIKKGEIHVLLGENGAGKSTLIKCIMGLHMIDSGKIIFDGKDISRHNIKDSHEMGIHVVYQELNNINCLSILENIFIGNEKTKNKIFIDWEEQRNEATEILNIVGLYDIDMDAQIDTLGVGAQQLIEISKGIYSESRLFIMDEPTSSLSKKEIDNLMNIMSELKNKGVSILFVTHKLDEAKKVGDRVTVLKDGKKVDTLPMADVTEDKIVTMMIGRKLESKFPHREKNIGDTRFEVSKVNSKKVHDISFSVKRGEVLGFFGLIGAGRTELMKTIFGADVMYSGDIIIDGKKVNINNSQDAVKEGIAYLTEDRKKEGLSLIHNVLENTTLVSLKKYTDKNHLLNEQKREKNADDVLYKVNLRPHNLDMLAMNFSGGNQQKIAIGKWILSNSKIFIFDEPTRGIDVGAKTEVYTMMNLLLSEGASIIMVSSEIQEILGMSDRVIVMYEGKITGEFVVDENITQEKIMLAAVGGKML